MFIPWKTSPSDSAPEFNLENGVKLKYYHLEKAYEGAIELDGKSGEWKPTEPKKASGKKERFTPLEEIIEKINEEFFGTLLKPTVLLLIPCTTK